MKKSIFSVFIFGIFLFLPIMLLAEPGQRFNIDGYSLHISATKLSSKLVVTGLVKGGDSCKNLQIYCYLIDENNRTDRVVAVIKNYSHTKKSSLKKNLVNNGGRRWKVSDVEIYK